jgi:hypothetical protein
VRGAKIEQSDQKNSQRDWMDIHSIRLERCFGYSFRSLFAAIVRARHVHHLTAVILHYAAAGTLFSRHLCIWSHARHGRCQARHQQQQNRTELPHKLHLPKQYA